MKGLRAFSMHCEKLFAIRPQEYAGNFTGHMAMEKQQGFHVDYKAARRNK